MRQRRTRELLLRDSSRLSEDLLTVTRLIQDNVQKSAHTVDTLGEYMWLEQRLSFNGAFSFICPVGIVSVAQSGLACSELLLFLDLRTNMAVFKNVFSSVP